jgi:hypothetical protein
MIISLGITKKACFFRKRFSAICGAKICLNLRVKSGLWGIIVKFFIDVGQSDSVKCEITESRKTIMPNI